MQHDFIFQSLMIEVKKVKEKDNISVPLIYHELISNY